MFLLLLLWLLMYLIETIQLTPAKGTNLYQPILNGSIQLDVVVVVVPPQYSATTVVI
jgi:hypothetical protein